MIESYATFEIMFDKASQLKWLALVEGLAQNQHGAYLEEFAEVFGEAAKNILEPLLDIWDEARDEIDTRGSTISEGKATIEMSGYHILEPSIEPMTQFLKACGASDVEVNTTLDSDYC
ncbi:hypothetical protein [Reinekea sp.]|jgi:hypothetical protein|uniref:hypothetical protein n=1 Tax=Reinekea sp. TaxID=1970455 RepID=UPI003989C960